MTRLEKAPERQAAHRNRGHCRSVAPWLIGLAALLAAPLSAQVPLGAEFQVNTYTTGFQFHESIAHQPDGGFIVVWTSPGSSGTDNDHWSVHARVYDAAGSPVEDQFQVNTSTAGTQQFPEVAASAAGFVVVWQDLPQDGVMGQRFDAQGIPLGGEFQLNTTPASNANPTVDFAGDGTFLSTWSTGNEARGRWFDAQGQGLGDEFLLADNPNNFILHLRAALGGNRFMVVWFDEGVDGDGSGIRGRLFENDGAPVGPQFQVNSYTTGDQSSPDIAHAPEGGYLVVWGSEGSFGSDSSEESVQTRFVGADGTPQGTDMQMNSLTTSIQSHPSVATGTDGRFIVTWRSLCCESSWAVKAAVADSSGPLADDFTVNAYSTDAQQGARVSTDENGDFVVVWRSRGSYGTDDDDYSVQARRFRFESIFSDGFESGDTSAWSNTVP